MSENLVLTSGALNLSVIPLDTYEMADIFLLTKYNIKRKIPQ